MPASEGAQRVWSKQLKTTLLLKTISELLHHQFPIQDEMNRLSPTQDNNLEYYYSIVIHLDLMHPLQARAHTHSVPNSSAQTLAFLEHSLHILKPQHCWEIGTAIWRWALHIANTLSARDGHLTSREISYPSYQVARTHLDPRQISNLSLYLADPCQISLHPSHLVQRCFIDCDSKMYQTATNQLLQGLSDDCILIYDDMHTASSKCPDLQQRLQSLWRHTSLHESEPWDRLLVATPQLQILDLLH